MKKYLLFLPVIFPLILAIETLDTNKEIASAFIASALFFFNGIFFRFFYDAIAKYDERYKRYHYLV